MNKTTLLNLFNAVTDAHNSATRVLISAGPGPAYDAAADAADVLEATLEAAADAYNAANPSTLSIPAY